MIEFYEFKTSGNCYKIKLMLSLLDLKFESRFINPIDKEHKSEQFLELNPFGQVPVLKDGSIILRDSQAILVYLARKYGKEHWFPIEPSDMAEIVSWLSIATNEVARGPALLRMHYLLGRKIDLEEAVSTTDQILSILDNMLSSRDWLVNQEVSIADIAIYPYLALSHQGNIDLSKYTNIVNWMSRVEHLPGYVQFTQ